MNFIMNACLIGKYGAVGASIGTVIAEFSVTAVQAYFVRKDFDLKEIVKLSKNYIISSVIMFIVCILIKNINAGKFATLVIQVITGGITYGICMLVLKDEFVREILKKINTKIKI